MLLKVTARGDLVYLEDSEFGCWLRFADGEVARQVTEKVRERFPEPYWWQLSEFRPLWTKRAQPVGISCNECTGRVEVYLSDGRRITAASRSNDKMSVLGWLKDHVGVRLSE